MSAVVKPPYITIRVQSVSEHDARRAVEKLYGKPTLSWVMHLDGEFEAFDPDTNEVVGSVKLTEEKV